MSLVRLISFLLRTAGERGARRVVALVVAAGAVAGAATTGLIALIHRKLNAPEAAGDGLVLAFAGLCLLLPASRFASEWLLVRLIQNAVYNLRLRLSRRILAAPLRRLEELGPHRLLAALTDDVTAISAALAQVPLLLMNLTIVAGCITYLGILSWRLLAVMLAVVVIGGLSYQIPLRRAIGHLQQSREAWDQVVQRFRGLVEGSKELKLSRRRRDAFFSRLLEPAAGRQRARQVAGATLFAAATTWSQLLFFLAVGLLLFVLPGVGGAGREVLTGYTLTLLYMLTPLDMVLNLVPSLGRSAVAVGKLERLGLPLAAPAAAEPSPPEPPAWRSIELAGVTHTYRHEVATDRFTLGPLDLRLQPGELVFLVGGNGSGKTTLAKLLMGLYRPEAGEVRVDGEPLDEERLEGYRQLFAAVFSDFFLFEALLGANGPRLDERARRYLRRLQLDTQVEVRDGELSTLELSQGQRKRLALLAAYLEDRPIYLFDEWAADQDPAFKEVFYRQLLPDLKARGKTVVVISHDDRYYAGADRLIELDYGNLAYDGPVQGWFETLTRRRSAAERTAPPAAVRSPV